MKKSKLLLAVGAFSMATCGLFAGCGGAQIDTMASIDKGGNWQAASATTATEYVAQEEVKTSMSKGYHLSAKGEMGDTTSFVNAYIVVDENGIPTGSAIKMEVKSGEESMLYTVYVKDGVMYTATEIKSAFGNTNSKIKMDLGDDETADAFLSGDEMEDMEILLTANQYLDNLSLIASGKEDKFVFEKATSGKTTKYRARLNGELEIEQFGITAKYSTAEMYLIFEDNAFAGASFEQTCSSTFAGETMTNTATIVISTFNGEIAYPSFDGYKGLEDLFE